jgi:uncharacterized membrane protein (DUF2068 family)
MTVTHDLSPSQADQASLYPAHLAGLRAVASLEITKGVLAILGGVLLLRLRHRDLGDVAHNIIEALHLNPAHRIFRAMIGAAGHMNGRRLIAVACVAGGYAIIRFIEAYGLWHARAWAEWFAILSGSAYFPLEILEVARHPDHIVRWGVLVVNILVVLYMVYVRWDALKAGNRLQGTGYSEESERE